MVEELKSRDCKGCEWPISRWSPRKFVVFPSTRVLTSCMNDAPPPPWRGLRPYASSMKSTLPIALSMISLVFLAAWPTKLPDAHATEPNGAIETDERSRFFPNVLCFKRSVMSCRCNSELGQGMYVREQQLVSQAATLLNIPTERCIAGTLLFDLYVAVSDHSVGRNWYFVYRDISFPGARGRRSCHMPRDLQGLDILAYPQAGQSLVCPPSFWLSALRSPAR